MFSFRSEIRELNESVRLLAGGSYIHLSDGVTHYELGNPASEKTVVLMHGFSVPYFIFDPTFHLLTQQGFRVLHYDLFGRGYSDRPEAQYNIDLFVKQLEDLLDALLLRQPSAWLAFRWEDPSLPHFIEDSSHIPHFEKPGETQPLLLEFLRKP